MKIAVFTESYAPYISGVARSVELLKKELEAIGHHIYLFAPDYPGHKDTEKNIIRIPSIATKYPGFRIPVPYPGFIPDIDFDLIHSNSPFGLGLASLNFAKRKRLPFVYSFHTIFTDYLHYVPLPKPLTKKTFTTYIKSFCSKCDCIIAPNKTTVEYLGDFGIRSRIETIPSGIDLELVTKATPKGIKDSLGIPERAKVILYVGRLSKEKDVSFLLRAFKNILSFEPDTYFLIVAGGPEEETLKSMASYLGIEKRTVFAGQKKYPDVLNYYKCADVFVFASKTETQGLVIAEAKACGLPAVVVDAQGVKESIVPGEDGFLTEDNIDDFSGKVVALLKDPSLRALMSERAAKNSARDFSSRTIAKKVESVYNSLIKCPE